jgi:hypothetical protein
MRDPTRVTVRTDATDKTDGSSWRGRWSSVIAMALFMAVSVSSVLSAQDLKTIKPSMTETQVREAWGEPLTARKAGVMMYLYYQNDCLRTCGTYDVVFLENGQVVDAVVRDRGRAYDGVASSPKDRKPEPTLKP